MKFATPVSVIALDKKLSERLRTRTFPWIFGADPSTRVALGRKNRSERHVFGFLDFLRSIGWKWGRVVKFIENIELETN